MAAPCRKAADRSRSRGGFTVVELTTVLAVIGILASMTVAQYKASLRQAKIARAIGDVSAIAREITAAANDQGLPTSLAAIGRDGMLDPWGRPYVYVNFAVVMGGPGIPGTARQDAFGVPVNTTFDLYSVGEDGQSAVQLNASASLDDIVAASDGGYFGLGSKF